MTLKKNNYKDRLVDKKIDELLEVFGAVYIEGPKWCGKTWTSLNHANSACYISNKETRLLANNGLDKIDTNDKPLLIDEWQLVPRLWDEVRLSCDMKETKGNYILTGSTSLSNKDGKGEVFHSGIGRIARVNMYPMSLFESGDSLGAVSLKDLFDDKDIITKKITKLELDKLASIIIRGGWPDNINTKDESAHLVPRQYIKALCENDIDEKVIDHYSKEKMRMIINSLSRNESTLASEKTILSDISDNENDDDTILSRITVNKYVDILDRLHIINNTKAYNTNYRSSDRIGKVCKRHLVDPSLSCAALNLTKNKLVNDHKTFGYMFEGLAIRDLKIYMNYLDGDVYHFKDNASGDEVDAILELGDGSYAACEIKLNNEYDINGINNIDKAIKSLSKFYKNVKKKPKFMFVLIGSYDMIMKDEETGIYIIPINALKN